MLGIVIAAVTLAGCSAISSGRVTEKEHTDAYYTTEMYCAYWKTGKNESGCGMWLPRQVYHDPTWTFDLSAEDKDGKTQTGWVRVDESTYNAYEVGDYYDGGN